MRITTFIHKTLMNQITLIQKTLQPHFGWHGARVRFLALFLKLSELSIHISFLFHKHIFPSLSLC
jgi:hypothetical protein